MPDPDSNVTRLHAARIAGCHAPEIPADTPGRTMRSVYEQLYARRHNPGRCFLLWLFNSAMWLACGTFIGWVLAKNGVV